MSTREFDVALGDLDDVEGVLDVQARLLTPDRARNREYLLWKYGGNPDRANSFIVIARVGNQVVGMRGYMGQRWTVGPGRTMSIPLAGDTVVAREHEGRGLLQVMDRAAAAECRRRGNPFMMNLSGGRAVYLQSRRSGWREIEPIHVLRRRPGRRSRWHNVRASVRSAWTSSPSVSLGRHVSDEALRALLAAAQPDRRPIAPVQSVEYWQWRLRCPLSQYWLLTAHDGGALLGFMVMARAWYESPDLLHAAHWVVRDAATFRRLLADAPDAFPDAAVSLWANTLDASEYECARSLGFEEQPPAWSARGHRPGALLVSTAASPGEAYTCDGIDLLDRRNWQYQMLNADLL